ncbi:unnamed protein product [Urochloa humidicola]
MNLPLSLLHGKSRVPHLYSLGPLDSLLFTPWQLKRLSLLSLDEASGASIVVRPRESWPGSVHHPIVRFSRRPSLHRPGDCLLRNQAIQTRGHPPSTSRTASRFTLIDFPSGNSKSISLLESFSLKAKRSLDFKENKDCSEEYQQSPSVPIAKRQRPE